ncbi:MAG: hypothetical protein A3G38_00375 [Omnitrophica WOR_2 bacterium RIFCSPLOWO2_12_FULL_51_8]|nr:MAG: hypothetical protein A3G38_00375 [Omnitrophica WOR_2 bacterium RIFCSPLOWO2_12_FULL_51_8]
MRKKFIICFLIIFAFIFTFRLYAAEQGEKGEEEVIYSPKAVDAQKFTLQKTPVNKLVRGFVNMTLCWAELFAQPIKVSKERNPGVGLTLGLVEGVFLSALRAATGLFDTVTCLIPPYDRPLMKPEYAFESPEKA